jgi:hypothetical protein
MRRDPTAWRDVALVDAWTAAQEVPRWQRPAVLLARLGALPDGMPPEALPLGLVGAAALRAARAASPGTLEAQTSCEACGEPIAIDLPAEAVLALAPAADEARVVEAAGHRLTLRAPGAADLAAVSAAPDAATAARLLLARCTVTAEPPLPDDLPGELPVELLDAADAAIEALDPLASLTLAVACPACGASQAPQADLAEWGLALLDARVRRLLVEVHRLASAYGWSEGQILDLGPARRRAYLELVP